MNVACAFVSRNHTLTFINETGHGIIKEPENLGVIKEKRWLLVDNHCTALTKLLDLLVTVAEFLFKDLR